MLFSFLPFVSFHVAEAAGMTKGGVVAIVMVIFLVMLLVLDAACCYTNNCGVLMFIATKVFGRKIAVHKTMEEGANGYVFISLLCLMIEAMDARVACNK